MRKLDGIGTRAKLMQPLATWCLRAFLLRPDGVRHSGRLGRLCAMVNHKLTAPGLPAGIVQRERLFCLLDKSSEKPVIWISGPGGSGKTTLVSSYLVTRKLSAIWYQVDQGDADPATFFYYMGLAFRDGVSSGAEPLPLLTPESLAGLKTFTRRYFDKLFTQLPIPFAIVLDNYQDVSSCSPFHELIMEGLSSI